MNRRDFLRRVTSAVAIAAIPSSLFSLARTETSSAIEKINLRRLSDCIQENLKGFLFESNDELTRERIRESVESLLSDVKERRGIQDYKVVCDTKNNSRVNIDEGALNLDVFIKPHAPVSYVSMNFKLESHLVEVFE